MTPTALALPCLAAEHMAKDTGPNVVAHGGYLTTMQKAVTAKFTLWYTSLPRETRGEHPLCRPQRKHLSTRLLRMR